MDMDLFNKNIVFLGIGGISMSALARLCLHMGANICGTDVVQNENIIALKKDKIAKIKIGNSPSMIHQADIVVYTNAIGEENPNLKLARRLHKRIYERATLLGLISCKYKHIIAVSGTHGKTTTTALLGWIFKTANLNPTVHIGGISQNFNSNIRIGSNKFFITEACEYQKSFLHINPNISIINNIELDHPDCYKNYDEIFSTFLQFSRQTKDFLVINGDNLDKTKFNHKQLITFGINKTNDVYANNIKTVRNKTSFCLFYKKQKLTSITTTMLGQHNIYNILAATSVALIYNININDIKQAIKTFTGTKRRYEILCNKPLLVLDYAHHPSEIKASINTSKQLSKDHIIAIFQPHTYSRTLALMSEFCQCFKGVDKLFILPTYPAREQVLVGGRAIDLFYNIKNVDAQYVSNPQSLLYELSLNKHPNDIILWLGAGDIENIARKYAKTLIKDN